MTMTQRSAPRRSAIMLVSICLAASLAGCSKSAPTKQDDGYFRPDPKTAADVTGKVRYTGKPPAHTTVNMDNEPQCAKLHQTPVNDDALVVNDGALANVFVYIKQGLEGKKFQPPADTEMPAVMDQKGCWFGPRVLGLQVGQTFKVTNSDPVTHNIHPLAQVNREWNQSQGPGAEPLTRRFSQPEVMMRVKCNIHGWMHAWVGVVPHPYFAVTGADGSFQFRDVPPGTYTIEAWQEQLGTQQKQVVLGPSGKGEVVFDFKGE